MFLFIFAGFPLSSNFDKRQLDCNCKRKKQDKILIILLYLRSILAERNVCLSWTTLSGTMWTWWPPCSSRSSASSPTPSSPQKCTTYLSMRVKSRKPTRDLMHLENYFTNCLKSIMKPCCTSSVILGWDFVKRKFSQFSHIFSHEKNWHTQ